MRVAFFTAGTDGAGHLVRGLAIQRALARAAAHVEYAMFGPRIAWRLAATLGWRSLVIDPAELLDPARASESDVARALASYRADVLLVDLYWAPLLHVLPLLAGEAWLLVRRVPPAWFTGPSGHPFDARRFARILSIEPGAGLGHATEEIDPVVVANPDERRPPGALRAALGLGSERLVVVHQAGKAGEWASLVAGKAGVHAFTLARPDLAPHAAPAGVRLHDGDAFFPLAEWLHGADEIVTGAGYNAFWEARWLGYADRTTFVPFERRIDDQAWRLRACATHVPRANGADTIASWLR
jgi:hypothetical protein